ncbi:MAG: phosphodiester glycosidase family protein [Anaerolineae bacterium]|nr:phosphodiester glycosidase family protein [Anaerolineae bacterium]
MGNVSIHRKLCGELFGEAMRLRILTFITRRLTARLMHWRRLRFSSLITAASLVSCALPGTSATPAGETDIAGEAWQAILPGLERRTYHPGGDHPFTTLLALRIDPANFTLRAHYEPGAAYDLNGWISRLPDAAAFINANFFDPQNRILGLLVADGIAHGYAYNDRGGLVQVQDGVVRVRSTLMEPYLGEALEQAVQAFPMLITDGAASFSNTRGDRPSRRTVVGQDAQGRIIILSTPSLAGITLSALSAYLPTTDLALVNAVNLDGGGSTMLWLNIPDANPLRIFSFDPVPAVLAVYPR